MVREVRFVDTSILCDLLEVPGKSQQAGVVREELERLVKRGVQLVLPIATIIETGNHIEQSSQGHARRRAAERFVALLRATAGGRVPWVLHSVAWDGRMLDLICDGTPATAPFEDLAGNGQLGAGDVSILAECELYRSRVADVTVGVWTHDARLAAYAL